MGNKISFIPSGSTRATSVNDVDKITTSFDYPLWKISEDVTESFNVLMIHFSSEKISFLVPFVAELRMESSFTTESDVWYISDNVVGSNQGKEFERVLKRTF